MVWCTDDDDDGDGDGVLADYGVIDDDDDNGVNDDRWGSIWCQWGWWWWWW